MTVLATAMDRSGLTVTVGPAVAVLEADGFATDLPVAADRPDCEVSLWFGPDGLSITQADGATIERSGQPVPEVFGFRTDLDPARAAGMSVTAEVVSPFATSPTNAKRILIGIQVVAAALALLLLSRFRRPRFTSPQWQQAWWIDAGVVTILAGWAVIGPLTVDDGWATTIARNFAATGSAGNYYRWWNADEVPFALEQQVLSVFTEVSLAPLWLRLPSTLLAVTVWFALTRGVLSAALPGRSRNVGIRAMAATFFLAAWLPFNLGARPETYVTLGVTVLLALVWRSRTPAGLGWAALAVGLTIPISPTAVVVVAPLAVFARRITGVLRSASEQRRDLALYVVLLCCIGAVGLTLIFADQTWSAFTTATDWHTFFGPSLPWYHEPDRYHYLLSGDQQGSAPKRVPVLLTAAMLPLAAVAAWRTKRSMVGRSTGRVAAVLTVALLSLALVPSKWSYHLGSVAGLFASFLTVATVLAMSRRHTSTGRAAAVTAALGTVLLAGGAALAFAGPNAWWQSTLYDVPWPTGPVQPVGLPLNNPLLWLTVTAALCAVVMAIRRSTGRQVMCAAPAALALMTAGTVVILLLGSFIAAPARRASGSLAMANLHRLDGSRACGLADDIEVLPDGPPLTAVDGGEGDSVGFRALAGYYPGAPPPDPPGTGSSQWIWGSYGSRGVATLTTPWFELPALATNDGVAVSVSGRTDMGNALVFEFGLGAQQVGSEAAPVDRVAVDEDPSHPLWRTIGIDVAQIPPGADRIRIRARSDATRWLAVTGPRLRSVLGMNQFLADHGPVLISWPQSFLFPCVRDIVEVSGGVGLTPRTVIESPRPFFTEDRDQSVAGTFAAITGFGGLQEIPTRLAGHPDIDWGALLTSPTDKVRDAYALTQAHTVRWGFDDAGRMPPQR